MVSILLCEAIAMFVRFVAGNDADDHRALTGVFTKARLLRDRGVLEDYEVALLEDVYAWFNSHLPVPPFSQRRWPKDVVTWFKDDTTEPISRVWEMIALLRENGVAVRILRSKNPGRVYYEDDMQVVVQEYREL